VNFEVKVDEQGPNTAEPSNAHVTTAEGSAASASTVTLAEA